MQTVRPNERQTATGAEIEVSGKKLRVHRPEQELGERRGGAEQNPRRQCERHARPKVRVRVAAFGHDAPDQHHQHRQLTDN
jgi:hypothetical protein